MIFRYQILKRIIRFVLHAKLGAYVASSKYDIKDEEILTAITYHTTGRPGMSLLEKIVYIFRLY